MKSQNFIALVITCILVGTLDVQALIVARWSFNETNGTVVHDDVGLLNGTLSPQGSAFVSGGISGNALSLSRAMNGFVNMGNALGFTTQPFSVVVWVKTAAGYSTGDSQVFSKHIGFSQNGYWMILNTTGGGGQTGKALFGEGTAAISVLSTTTVTDGSWHQIVCTFQPGTNLAIYVDGAPAEDTNPASASLIPNNAPFLVGAVIIGTAVQARYTGLIDEMQVYNHALTPEQVNFLYANPTAIIGPTNCADQLVLTQQQLANSQAQLQAANLQINQLQTQLGAAQAQLTTASDAIQLLTLDFQDDFKDSQFQVPGANVGEQVENLILGIGELSRGHRRGLYYNLGGTE